MAITEVENVAQINDTRPGNAIFVSINETGKDRYAVDVRRWYIGDDEEWHPTTKGISIPAARLSAVLDAIQAAAGHEVFSGAVSGSQKPPQGKPAAKKTTGRKAAPRKATA